MTSAENTRPSTPENGSPLRVVELSPTTWDAINSRVAARHPVTKEFLYTEFTLESFEELLGEVIEPDEENSPTTKPAIRNFDDTPLSPDQVLASFEALQEHGMIGKEALEDNPGVFPGLWPEVKPNPAKPSTAGYGPEYSSSKTARFFGERKDELLTRPPRIAGLARAIGGRAVKATKWTTRTTHRQARDEAELQAEEAQEQAEIHAAWAPTRQTKLVLKYGEEELEAIRNLRIHTAIPTLIPRGGAFPGMRDDDDTFIPRAPRQRRPASLPRVRDTIAPPEDASEQELDEMDIIMRSSSSERRRPRRDAYETVVNYLYKGNKGAPLPKMSPESLHSAFVRKTGIDREFALREGITDFDVLPQEEKTRIRKLAMQATREDARNLFVRLRRDGMINYVEGEGFVVDQTVDYQQKLQEYIAARDRSSGS